MKKLAFALALLAVSPLCGQEKTATTASPTSTALFSSNKFYTGAMAGWTWSGDLDGPSGSLFAGMTLDPARHHAIELEFFYAELEDKNKTVTGNLTFAGPPPITMFTTSKISKARLLDRILFVNYRYLHQLNKSVGFSLGAGIGANFISMSTTGSYTLSTTIPAPVSSTFPRNSSTSETKVAGQIFAGANVNITEQFALVAEIRPIFTQSYDFRATDAKVETKTYQLSASVGFVFIF